MIDIKILERALMRAHREGAWTQEDYDTMIELIQFWEKKKVECDRHITEDCVSCAHCFTHINRNHDVFTRIDDKGNVLCASCMEYVESAKEKENHHYDR